MENLREKSNSFCVIIEDGQMKRVDHTTYQNWKEEKKDIYATSIVQPESGTIYGIYFRGEGFETVCQDPQVWHLVIDSMTAEDYRKLKDKYPEIEGIDGMIGAAEQQAEPEPRTPDKNWDELKAGDVVEIEEQPIYETFATQSELLRYLKENYINEQTEKAYYIGIELPFQY